MDASLKSPPSLGDPADGISAAYFLELAPVLRSWAAHLRPGGWIALTEIDDKLGHAPVAPRTRELIDRYVADALDAKRNDFYVGRKLSTQIEAAGLAVLREFTVADAEFSCSGPSSPEVVAAWRAHFDLMRLLREHRAGEFNQVRDDFLRCLETAEHRSTARVMCCIGERR